MKLDHADLERNTCLVIEGMSSFGIEPGALANVDAFLAEYTVPVAADGLRITELILDAAPGGPLCRYDLQGRFFLNLARLTDIVGREHRYPLFIMASLHRRNQWIGLSINWDGFDPYLLRRSTPAGMSDIHWLFLHFHYHYQRLTDRVAETRCGFETMAIGSAPALFARPGVVELRALRTVMEHDGTLAEMTREIAARQHEDAFMYAPWTSNDADAADPLWTIRMLMTNAGMYGDAATLERSLRDWAGRYRDGLRHSHELFNWWDYSMHGHTVRLLAEQRGLHFDRLAPRLFPSTEEFYRQMAGRRVLFVTPYAQAVEHTLRSGNIARIWKNLRPPPLTVRTAQAFVSTYPNAPHGSWRESFAALAARVDIAIVDHGIDLVIAACGCYGIPLLHHCRQRHDVSAVYFGNKLNMWFGVKQNAFADDYSAANLEHWADPFMGWPTPVPTNIERIDAGRYIATPRG